MDYKYKVDYPLIAKRVKEARKFAGLTQEQLAEKIDISAKLENNLMTASLQTLVNLSNVLGIDINYLLCEEYTAPQETSRDAFLDSLIHGLSQREKEFVIHVIHGLKLYNLSEEG